jgi:polyisoprenoid-binding protein YceI
MRLAIAALAAVLIWSAPAAAAPHWTVDHGKSRLGFLVMWSGQALNATFKSWKADIAFDPADLAHSKAVVTIDLNSETSGFDENDDGMKGAEGFAVDRFPSAKFETSGFRAMGGNTYQAAGQLNLHGMSKPVTVTFNLTLKGNTAHVVGKATVSRLDFGLGSGEWAAETPIAHGVVITLDLTATKAP